MANRCPWCGDDPLYVAYHDQEWGVPVHEDRRLFEFLILEGAQAGLSWITILRKRENYRRAMDNFDIAAIAAYLLFKIILPLIRTMTQPPVSARQHSGQTGALGGNIDINDEESTTPLSAAEALEQKIVQARAMVQTDPKAVANIIKDWTGANAGG